MSESGKKPSKGFCDTGIFRSELMQYLKFMIPKDCGHQMLRRFGELNCLHLVDLNSESQGGSSNSAEQMEVKKRVLLASSWDRRLSAIEEKLVEYKIDIDPFEVDALMRPLPTGEQHADALAEVQVGLNFKSRCCWTVLSIKYCSINQQFELQNEMNHVQT